MKRQRQLEYQQQTVKTKKEEGDRVLGDEEKERVFNETKENKQDTGRIVKGREEQTGRQIVYEKEVQMFKETDREINANIDMADVVVEEDKK